MGRFNANRRTQAILMLLFAIGMFSGCVERRYTIRTDPPGKQCSLTEKKSAHLPLQKASTTMVTGRSLLSLMDIKRRP